MDQANLISRIQLAAELGVATQTIAHWEREGWFPRPKRRLSTRLIFYLRSEVEAAMERRARRTIAS